MQTPADPAKPRLHVQSERLCAAAVDEECAGHATAVALVEAAGQKLPAWQVPEHEELDKPALLPKRPAEQAAHALWPVVAVKKPRGQLEQRTFAIVFLNEPAAQAAKRASDSKARLVASSHASKLHLMFRQIRARIDTR